MGDLIKAIYGNGLQPIRSTERTQKPDKGERSSDAPTKREGIAAGLVPDLRDKVEISEEGRKAARAGTKLDEPALPNETTQAVTDNWLSVGYQISRDTLDS